MKVLREYPNKKVEYNFEDAEAITSDVTHGDSDLAIKICRKLKELDVTLVREEKYDPASGWRGADIFVGRKITLSGNGFLSCVDDIKAFVNGEQRSDWYKTYTREYKEAIRYETKQEILKVLCEGCRSKVNEL